MNGFTALLRRDLALALRIGGGFELGLVFFLMIVAVTPFAIGPDAAMLSRLAPAILWIAALLAALLGLDRLFQADAEEGALDHLRMAALPLELSVLAKMLAHWLTTGLPVAMAAPAFGLMLSIEPAAMPTLAASLLVGTPALTGLGAVGASLTASLRRGGLLSSVLVLPLMLPTLIFGVAAAQGTPFQGPFLALCGVSVIAVVVGAVAAAAALRIDD